MLEVRPLTSSATLLLLCCCSLSMTDTALAFSTSRPTTAFGSSTSSSSSRTTMPTRHHHPTPTTTTALSISSVDMFFNDHHYLFSGIVSGIVLSIGTSVSRNVQADQAWEERIREAQVQKKRNDPNDTRNELDLRAELAEMSPSMYGPEAQARRRRQREDEDLEYDDDDDDVMSAEEIREFETAYGIEYDPFYDQGYDEDELPNSKDFSTDPYFGDRVYDDGETFFLNDGKYYRKGSKPRKVKLLTWGNKKNNKSSGGRNKRP